ncbi:MAG: NusA-like transcription termination signal-binding factor [Halobacteriaceae archaeon]
MRVTISEEARQYIAAFEDATGATARDCLLDEAEDRVVFVVKTGEMGQAIGPGGERVRDLEDRFGRDVTLVEDAPTAEGFVANALAPAAVYNVTINDTDEGTVAFAEVDDADRGVAIGSGGQNIELAKRLASRHFDVDDIQLT